MLDDTNRSKRRLSKCGVLKELFLAFKTQNSKNDKNDLQYLVIGGVFIEI